MSKINVLDSSIFNRISAGEVVERPASAIKELVENSIDAGAKNIVIRLYNGGLSKFSVTDDGCGIDYDDLKTAFLPHATSKISKFEDIETVSSLGFRGEALPSIASVSMVNIKSVSENCEKAFEMNVNGGVFSDISEVSLNKGTVITVSNLFFNAPVRARFMKSGSSESTAVSDMILRLILSNPNISIKYYIDDKNSYYSEGKGLEAAIISVYGKKTFEELLKIDVCDNEGYKISGYIGKSSFVKSTRAYQTLIVNGRYVISPTISATVQNAYSDFLMKRQYPFFILNIETPRGDVDVNIHPNKREIRLLNERKICSMLYSAVYEAVYRESSILRSLNSESVGAHVMSNNLTFSSFGTNNYEIDAKKQFETNRTSEIEKKQISFNFEKVISKNDGKNGVCKGDCKTKSQYPFDNNSITNKELKVGELDACKVSSITLDNRGISHNSVGSCDKSADDIIPEITKDNELKLEKQFFSVVGVLFNTYLIVEARDSFILIDQHAAHERLLFDKLKSEISANKLVVQELLLPYDFDVSDVEREMIISKTEVLKKIGFELRSYGNSFSIMTVPSLLSDMDIGQFVSVMVNDIDYETSDITEIVTLKEKLMQKACKSAVKGGDKLSESELDSLLSMLFDDNTVLKCPHGRPVVVEYKKSDLEKMFKRVV